MLYSSNTFQSICPYNMSMCPYYPSICPYNHYIVIGVFMECRTNIHIVTWLAIELLFDIICLIEFLAFFTLFMSLLAISFLKDFFYYEPACPYLDSLFSHDIAFLHVVFIIFFFFQLCFLISHLKYFLLACICTPFVHHFWEDIT